MRTIKDGLVLGESPRWHDGRLWVCDWGAGRSSPSIRTADARSSLGVAGRCRSASTSCPTAALLVVVGRDGRLLRREPDGSLATHADLTRLRRRPGTRSSSTAAATPMSTASASTSQAASSRPGIVALVTPGRRGAAGGRRRGVPQRHGGHARQPDADRRRVLRHAADRVRHRGRRRPFGPAGVGRPRRRRTPTASASTPTAPSGTPTSRTALRARPRGRRGARDGRARPRLLRLHARRAATDTTLFVVAAEWRGPSDIASEAGTGVVVAVDAPAPHAGWP